ncbi:MAG TPA: OmpA family protein [Kofleriaceae bacterium]|nr:OmpA family protein [Kofleriaceae bacterium]
MTRGLPAALATTLACVTGAGPALAGPDFVTADRSQPLAASDARSVQQPLDDIVFALDSAALLPAAQVQLADAARWLSVHPGHRMVLEGYADSSGPAIYNQDLATRRVEIARNHLVACGVPSDRIVIAVFGEVLAHPRPDPLDRRVILFATEAPVAQVVAGELDREAIELSWSSHRSVYRETRGISPVATNGPEARPESRPAPRPRMAATGRHGG